MKDLGQLLLELVLIPSPTGREQELSKHLFETLDPLEHYDCQQLGLGLCYFGPQEAAKPTLAFFGHLDTVMDQQTDLPCIKEGRVYGCGASDMKAGLAVMVSLMQKINTQLCQYNLIFVFYDREEGPYLENGLEPILQEMGSLFDKIDLAFVLEPTDNQIEMGCLGGLHAEVGFSGKSAHSARPWQGENALHKAWGLLKKLSETERKEVEFGGLKFYEVLSATQGRTNNSRNSIPATFELNLNYRFAPGKSLEQAKEEFLAWVGPEVSVRFVDEAPSAPVLVGNRILDQFVTRYQLSVLPKQAWTDIARLALAGIPAVNFGPGSGAMAHQKDEWASLQELERNYQTFSSFLLG
ncbi:MAG: succinyl-diaminopimelate desuccinylase [Candidatus Lambdaproteobacteria bacterium RIFOXYD1_FULL_56_27]|uniref:Succinyl-diaminopimelate desuccinylase n=1 Tax=Candidatus Lambdaproteobacteria bacterium RIFOXYD2_FULL_56_26 TaxID=1817773 RepID=A0A1F6GMS0_9PROT|nr:MAG: succinyl-diaminopimelate desuccinylase [Candidatus Lambdaproteobacteria bacterium RIFOXYD2_FULL_56_26]OGH05599.1 MAG: succinyl-diaminopimelate desuccinylase [Candidatus Lambdaproteobacteria bacterium RIFOXYC1_FULL_56_13]OGH08559.1 MAG: succinyl-diaminopimelate desuccinylase [Candidatus Lambdaproteobacteria bacterium RIFOXYD1_FULL_56_27]